MKNKVLCEFGETQIQIRTALNKRLQKTIFEKPAAQKADRGTSKGVPGRRRPRGEDPKAREAETYSLKSTPRRPRRARASPDPEAENGFKNHGPSRAGAGAKCNPSENFGKSSEQMQKVEDTFKSQRSESGKRQDTSSNQPRV